MRVASMFGCLLALGVAACTPDWATRKDAGVDAGDDHSQGGMNGEDEHEGTFQPFDAAQEDGFTTEDAGEAEYSGNLDAMNEAGDTNTADATLEDCAAIPRGVSCSAACTSSPVGCQSGDACNSDADCHTSGDANASCDVTGKVCVTVCPGMTIVSQTNLDAAKYCKEIDGDLDLQPNFNAIGADALPYLTRVRGKVIAANPGGLPALTSITISKLQTVDGQVGFTHLTNATTISLPHLTSAGGLVLAVLLALEHVSLPVLRDVQGPLAISNAPQLNQVDIGDLETVAGSVTLAALCALPWSQVRLIGALGNAQTVSEIGCCNMSTDRNACVGGNCDC
jgi:hypothetical protein